MTRFLALVVGCLLAAMSGAQAWPDKTMRMVVPFAAGGTTDAIARLVAQRLSMRLGQSMIVENVPGAAGNIGAALVAKSAPDGYTVLMATPGQAVMNQFMYRHMPYDPASAFIPLAYIASIPSVLVVTPALNISSVRALLAYAKDRPDGATFGSAGMGSTGHLGGLLLSKQTDMKATHVPYRGSAPMLQDLIAGQIQFTIDTVPGGMSFIQSGTLQPLAITGTSRSPALPDVPSIKEAGVSDVEMSSWLVLLAPAGTPQAIVDKINAETNAALKEESALRDGILKLGAVPEGGSLSEVAAFLQNESAKWKRIIDLTGVRID